MPLPSKVLQAVAGVAGAASAFPNPVQVGNTIIVANVMFGQNFGVPPGVTDSLGTAYSLNASNTYNGAFDDWGIAIFSGPVTTGGSCVVNAPPGGFTDYNLAGQILMATTQRWVALEVAGPAVFEQASSRLGLWESGEMPGTGQAAGLTTASNLGMGGVFLRRPYRVRAEVVNDISRDVTNLFRILQRHYVPFMDTLKWQLTSRSEYERLAAADPDTLTDLERAARFLYLQRTAYAGKVSGRNFGVAPGIPARFDITKLGQMLEDVHERLAGVVIERLPWAELLTRYDRPDALFYLDPPYWGGERDYGAGIFSKADFSAIANALEQLQGQFLLSINDVPEIRSIFGHFHIDAVTVPYGIAGGASMPELLISREPVRDLLS